MVESMDAVCAGEGYLAILAVDHEIALKESLGCSVKAWLITVVS